MGSEAGRTDEPRRTNRLTIAQAADQLGITEGAVRSRIKRATLPTERAGGRVYVLLGGDQPPDRPGESNVLISQMRDEIAYLREENRRKDHIIAGLVERIPPAIEAPRNERERPETASEGEGGGAVREEAEEATERPWWRAIPRWRRRISGR